MMIPKTHPRYTSLMLREKISQAMKKGIVHETGLIAHGRGETFDYLIGEKTLPVTEGAEKTAAAYLIDATHPVISVNGNVAALAAKDCYDLAKMVGAQLEVNLFHYNKERLVRVAEVLRENGADVIRGLHPDTKIPGLDHSRANCCSQGIYKADVVVVALEDGDRCQALKNMGKTIIAIDLNPLSRTAQSATLTIVDNVVRALPRITEWVQQITPDEVQKIIQDYDNEKYLSEVLDYIAHRLRTFEKTDRKLF